VANVSGCCPNGRIGWLAFRNHSRRIDRFGSDFDHVYAYNFLPETGIERNLGLRQRLQNRIREIHDTIGEDSAILDRTEQLGKCQIVKHRGEHQRESCVVVAPIMD